MANGNLGNLKIGILWDVKSFSDGAKSILNIATMTGKNMDAALKLKPFVFPLSNFDAEVKKIDASLKKFQGTVTETKSALTNVTPAVDTTKNSINALDTSIKKTTESKSLFRQKSVNLGADLTILSFGVQKVGNDIADLRNEMNKADGSALKMAGSLGNASLSLLSMIPALNALKSALPAPFLAALAPIAAVMAALTGMYVFITKFTEQLPALSRAFRFLTGEISFSEGVAEFEKLQRAGENTKQMFYDLSYQANQFRNIVAGLNINSPTLGIDIKKKYDESNAGFADYYKKVVNGTASINESNIVLNKLKERQNELQNDPENLKTINKTIEATQKYIDKLQNAGLVKPSGNNSKTPDKEKEKQLNTEQQILKQIAELESKLAIETLPLQSREFEKQISLLRDKLRYLKGDFEKINLDGFSPKLLPEEKIQSRKERGDNSPGGIAKFSESIANLKAQLIGLGALEGIMNGITSSFGGLFAAFVPPQGADTPLKNFLKSVVTSIITAVQASILAAQGFAAAQSVFSFGLSLLKDAPLIAIALAALEAAKGFISGFKVGGYTGDGDENEPAGVVHKGEFVIRKSRVRSLVDSFGTGFLSFLNGGGMMPNFSGGYSSGGIVNTLTGKPSGDSFEAHVSGEFTDAMKIDFYKNGKRLNNQFNKAVRVTNN